MSPVQNMISHCFRYSRILVLFLLFSIPFLSCNKNEIKCEGCGKDTPWSNNESSYCYPTKAECEAAEGGKTCEKCR
jgi:hypothetical protein